MKKGTNLLLLLLAISPVLLTNCDFKPMVTGSENITEEELNYNDFCAIDLSHSVSAEIIQSDQNKVTIQYNANLKEYLIALKEGKTIKFGLKGNHYYRNVKLSVKIYMPEIKVIKASGVCKINISKFKTENLQIDLSGASYLQAVLEIGNNLKINASGASSIILTGNAKNADLLFSGASKLSGKGMTINDFLNIDCSGASSLTMTADGKISLELSGASTINYYGKGSIIKSDVSGASSIRKKE